jgi:hypothetical protein
MTRHEYKVLRLKNKKRKIKVIRRAKRRLQKQGQRLDLLNTNFLPEDFV